MSLEQKLDINESKGLLSRIKKTLARKIATYSLAFGLALGSACGCGDNNGNNKEKTTSLIGSYDTLHFAYEVYVDGDYAYVAFLNCLEEERDLAKTSKFFLVKFISFKNNIKKWLINYHQAL